jgi:hypothetical protein
MIEIMGVAWAWSTLSKLFAYPNSRFLHMAKGVKVGLYHKLGGVINFIPSQVASKAVVPNVP